MCCLFLRSGFHANGCWTQWPSNVDIVVTSLFSALDLPNKVNAPSPSPSRSSSQPYLTYTHQSGFSFFFFFNYFFYYLCRRSKTFATISNWETHLHHPLQLLVTSLYLLKHPLSSNVCQHFLIHFFNILFYLFIYFIAAPEKKHRLPSAYNRFMK